MTNDTYKQTTYTLALAALEGARKFYAANPQHLRSEKKQTPPQNSLTYYEQLSIFGATGDWYSLDTE